MLGLNVSHILFVQQRLGDIISMVVEPWFSNEAGTDSLKWENGGEEYCQMGWSRGEFQYVSFKIHLLWKIVDCIDFL